ncbi:MAG: DUF3419 family protein [Saprospiraceae bacterium]|nr:DUF3419 family protein [Saprospiraceae bacterium]
MLTSKPKELYAVDMNIAQLYLCELKAVAFSELAYDDMLQFFMGTPHSKDYLKM